jgi:cytochrome c oxidase assembly factor CtaG
MSYVQRFIAWCIGVIILIAAVTLGIFALTHPGTTSHIITTVVGALVAAGKGAADIVITVVNFIGGLFS